MRNIKLIVASLFMGSLLLTGCGNNFVESEIEYETENEFVVEFDESVAVDSDIVASVENMTNATYKARPYEGFFVFTVEDGSYAQLESICESVSELPGVKAAHTKWEK